MSSGGKFTSRSKSERGFTLIELLVVILLIGVLAAIALPAFVDHNNPKPITVNMHLDRLCPHGVRDVEPVDADKSPNVLVYCKK